MLCSTSSVSQKDSDIYFLNQRMQPPLVHPSPSVVHRTRPPSRTPLNPTHYYKKIFCEAF
jgi:hypothetical protein